MKRTWLFVALVVAATITAAYAMMRTRPVPQPVIAPQGAVARPPGATLEVTYIANMGVLLAAGETQVLIDGLHRLYEASYPFLPDPYREQIETAQAPFGDIDVILVSHRHGDHFHPESVARHLRHNTAATLVSSEQVVTEVQKQPDVAAIQARIRTITPPLKARVSTEAGGVRFDILGVGHGTGGRHGTIQNLGHVVTLGGKKILHIGDASTEDASIFDAFDLDQAGIDVAILPMWFLTSDEGAAIVRQHIKPKHILAVHMPARELERGAARVKERFPDAVPMIRLLEKRFY